MSRFIDFMGDVARGAGARLVAEEFAKGYDEAADILMRILSEEIDELSNRPKVGRYLSEQDQFLLSSLCDIRARIQAALKQ
ncbi:hypothetical protein [Micromonospora sp. NPDC049102]|uniref:hypothetical protein n=1 Tax=Micromonospora sp. NPDC049102 TaxID=3364265 RepID=UPI00371D032B